MARKRAAATEAPAETSTPEPVQPTEATPAEPVSAEQRTKEPASASVGEMRPSTYFRKILKKNPKLLKERDNEAIFKKWLKDHPGHESVPQNIKQLLSNIKSTMRKAHKASRGKKAHKEAPANGTPAPAKLDRLPVKGLERLEDQLDKCVLYALETGTDELERVVHLLRKARRHVSIMLGL